MEISLPEIQELALANGIKILLAAVRFGDALEAEAKNGLKVLSAEFSLCWGTVWREFSSNS